MCYPTYGLFALSQLYVERHDLYAGYNLPAFNRRNQSALPRPLRILYVLQCPTLVSISM